MVDGVVVPKVESRKELVILCDVVTWMKDETFWMEDLSGWLKVFLPIVTETPTAVEHDGYSKALGKGAEGGRDRVGECEDLSAEIESFSTRDDDGEYLDVFKKI
ncbi:hypothetical protein ACHAWF_014843 [Thalassiosira exigua]